MNTRRALAYGVNRLRATSDSPDLDAQVLLCFVTGLSQVQLFTELVELSEQDLETYQQLIENRAQSVPIAYLTGHKEFWSLDLIVTPDTLIPRPETETLVEYCLAKLPVDAPIKVLELGTGSGAISLALGSERPNWQCLATDIDPACVQVAMQNAKRLGIHNVRVHVSDWYQDIAPMPFDLIISNPPYISPSDPRVGKETHHEPVRARFAEEQGLADIRAIIQGATPYLACPGLMVLEHGNQQADAVCGLLQSHGFTEVETRPDLAGHPRLSAGQKKIFD